MNKVEKFAKSSMIYFIGQMATKMISFLLLPLYSNRFSTEDYGYFDYSSSILNVIVPLVCLEIWSCILRYMFDYKEEKEKYKVITNGLGIWGISVSIYTAGFIGLNIFLDIKFGGLIFVYGIVLMLQNLYCAIVRGLGKNWMYMASGVVSSTVIILVNIVLIVGLNRSTETLFISGIIGGITQILMLEYSTHVIANLHLCNIDKLLLKKMLRFSAPLCVNTVAFWLLNSYGRFPIKYYLGMEQNGIYAMASRFTVILSLFVTVFQLAWQELTYSIGNEKDRAIYYSKGINLLIRFLGCCMIMLLPFTKLAFTLINTEYKVALSIIPLYYLGTMASSVSVFLGSIFGAEKKNGIIMYSTLTAGIVNVIVIQFTIQKIGLQGVVLALFLGFLSNIIIRIIMLKRYVGLKLDVKILFVLSLLYIGTTYIFYSFNIAVNAVWLFVLALISFYLFKDMVWLFIKKINVILRKRSER